MTSSNSQSGPSCKATGDDPQDPILASIRTMEAIRDFAADIIPLRSDGANIHEWVGEVDKTLSDLVDRPKYLQGTPVTPFSKAEDKIARNMIYWTIPRELRSCINDTTSAHEAYKALQAQFLRNNRTSHMAALVDLFNVHAPISEPHHITMLYDRMYKGVHELVASGFVVNEDTLLGALFQIAVGRGNTRLYAATSKCLDTLVPSDRPVTSREVAAAARREFEHLRNTVFDEEPITHTPNEVTESLHAPVNEEGNPIIPCNGPNLSTNAPANTHAASQSTEDHPPANIPSKRQNPRQELRSHRESGSSTARADQPASSKESSSSAAKEPSTPPVVQATQPTKPAAQTNSTVKNAAEATQPVNPSAQPQPPLFSNFLPSADFGGATGSEKARAISPAPTKPPTTNNTATASLFGKTPVSSSPSVTNITPSSASTTETTGLFAKTASAAASTNLFASSGLTATPLPTSITPSSVSTTETTGVFAKAAPNLFASSGLTATPLPMNIIGSQNNAQPDSGKTSLFGNSLSFSTSNTTTTATPAAKSSDKRFFRPSR